MLRATLAASAGLLLSGVAGCATRPASGASKRRVVIIGAGLGGLACAHELHAAGHDVIVLEARSRVGGRVLSFSDMAPGAVVEGGGEFIGSNHPVWLNYAEQFRIELREATEDETLSFPVVLGGRRLTDEEVEELYTLLDAAHELMTSDARAVDADAPWSSPDAASLDRRSVADWIRDANLSDVCRRAMDTEFAADNGVSTARQSSLAALAMIKGGGLEKFWTDSEVFRCSGGNQRLASAIASELGARVRLRSPVAAVDRTGSVVRVTLVDGSVVEGDDVVLGIAPTVWNRVRFEPGLPTALGGGADVQMGSNIKWMASVKSRFWLQNKLAPDSVSDGDISLTWEATDGQEGQRGAVLTAFSGAQASENCRRFAAARRDQEYLARLEPMYPGMGEQFISSRFMDWPGDEWAGASYSFPAPGQLTRVGAALREGQDRLHFVGEHVSTAFPGYMEGALASGVAVAKRLAT